MGSSTSLCSKMVKSIRTPSLTLLTWQRTAPGSPTPPPTTSGPISPSLVYSQVPCMGESQTITAFKVGSQNDPAPPQRFLSGRAFRRSSVYREPDLSGSMQQRTVQLPRREVYPPALSPRGHQVPLPAPRRNCAAGTCYARGVNGRLALATL